MLSHAFDHKMSYGTHRCIKAAQAEPELLRRVVKSPHCHQTPLKTLQHVLTEAAFPVDVSPFALLIQKKPNAA